MLSVRMTTTTSVLQQWGMGSAKVLAKHNAAMPDNLQSSRT